MRMSAIRQETWLSRLDFSRLAARANTAAEKPADSSRSLVESRIDSSSSTIATSGPLGTSQASLPPRYNGRRSELLKTDRGGAGYGQDVVVWARAIPTGNRLGQGTQCVPVFGWDDSCGHYPNPGVA